MSIIKGLIKKDIYNLASYKQTIVILIAFVAVFSTFTSNITGYLPIAVSTAIGLIILSTFNYDEISNSEHYILALPTNREEIVKTKYLLSIGATIIGGILGFILAIIVTIIINYIRPENIININFSSLIVTTIGGMFGIGLVQAIQIPSIYKWGAEKGRIQMFILVFGLVAIVVGIGFLLTKMSVTINIELIKVYMEKFGVLLLVILIIIMYYVSYKIAYKIYKNKEN